MKYRFKKETGIDTVLYDCKVVKGLSLAQSKVYPHQVKALIGAGNDEGCHHKISDGAIGRKPADAFFMSNAHGFLIILFQKDDNDRRFFGLFDMKNWDKKSITPDRCYALFRLDSLNKIPVCIKPPSLQS